MLASQQSPSLFVAAVAIVLIGALFSAAPVGAETDAASFEACLLAEINAARAAEGADGVALAIDLTSGVRDHSEWMSDNTFEHMSSSNRDALLPASTITWGENVAYSSATSDCGYVHDMLMASPDHRANIVNGAFRFVAIGVHDDGAAVWVTELFFDASSYLPPFNGTFWDDDNSVLEGDIEKLAAAGITDGCGPSMYCPNEAITRAHMAAFLTRALELPVASSAGFSDTAGHPFESDIDSLAAAGITSGCKGSGYCPDEPVTRAQMAAFLVRAFELPPGPPAGFADTSGNIFNADIDALAASGVTHGCGGNDFCPNDIVTRAQMAAFLVRALGL